MGKQTRTRALAYDLGQLVEIDAYPMKKVGRGRRSAWRPTTKAPIAYYAIYQYTADYVVKAPVGIGIFVLALLLVTLISMGTLYWQIRKAANIDPATVMKTE